MNGPPTSADNGSQSATRPGRLTWKWWRWILGALGIFLAWNALHAAPWDEILDLLAGLGLLAIVSLILVNLVMLPLMTMRWWLLLKTFAAPISLFQASLYKNSANAISYITPGPHFGGEPFLIYILRQRHGIPVSIATTSVVVDRLIEFLASIILLTICLLYLLGADFYPFSGSHGFIVLALAITAFICLFAALSSGNRPLSRLFVVLDELKLWRKHQKTALPGSISEIILQGEMLAEQLFRNHRPQFIAANLLSIGHWLWIFIEFWLMAFFLGFPLSLIQLITVVVAARLAFFTPLPAGIGALESALPFVTAALGFGNSLGFGICLIIRLRDIIFSLTGVVQSMNYLTCSKKTSIINDK